MSDSPIDFAALVRPFLPDGLPSVAVALSGGPDSMALCHVLAQAAQRPVHALTVDHGLRPESADEARQVGVWVADWPDVTHHVLTRDAVGKDRSKIQEDARHDRYALMAEYCTRHGLGQLFTAHHLDDQAETFLFRLAKGSGLDGLGAIRSVHDYSETLQVIRPFLAVPKNDLVAYCRAHDISFVADPSNENERFARVRLRQSYDVLEREGLSAKRLGVTAGRLARARTALDFYAAESFEQAQTERKPDRIVLDFAVLRKAPEEIRLRVLLRALEQIGESKEYGPRMERVEELVARLFDDPAFKKASLGGCLIGYERKNGQICIEKERRRPT